jgi:hypothetical protein
MIVRVTGLAAWYLLIADVIVGTMIRGGIARVTVAFPRKFAAHRILGWVLFASVIVHIFAILNQHYHGWGIAQVAVPSPSGPLSRDCGVIAAWLLVIVIALAVFKQRVPNRLWHWIHRRIPFILLAFGTLHGLLAGGIDQGIELPVIAPAIVALTLLLSVFLVRANTTATRRLTRPSVNPVPGDSLARTLSGHWSALTAAMSGRSVKGSHAARPTRQTRQARSLRIMTGFAGVLCLSVLVFGAEQFGTAGLRSFITRQGGVGATPDTKNCGHLSICSVSGSGGATGRRLTAAPARARRVGRKTQRPALAPDRSSKSTQGTVASTVLAPVTTLPKRGSPRGQPVFRRTPPTSSPASTTTTTTTVTTTTATTTTTTTPQKPRTGTSGVVSQRSLPAKVERPKRSSSTDEVRKPQSPTHDGSPSSSS